MDAFYRQFQFLHTLLPYFPATNRMFFSYLLYFLEFRHMCEAFRVEQDLLHAAPDEPEFPDTETLLGMLTKNMPRSDVDRIKKMIDMMKMMEMMEGMNMGQEPPEAPPPPGQEPEPGFSARMQSADPPPPPTPPPGINNDMLKRMMSPKQQELFAQYQNLFKNE